MEIIHVIDVISQIISIVPEKNRVGSVQAESSKVNKQLLNFLIGPSLFDADVSIFNEV